MRIVAWNCNMALHNKYERLLALRPDIAVIGNRPWVVAPRATRRDDRDAAAVMRARGDVARARAQQRLQLARKIVEAIGKASG
jgi:hypothetical protein